MTLFLGMTRFRLCSGILESVFFFFENQFLVNFVMNEGYINR